MEPSQTPSAKYSRTRLVRPRILQCFATDRNVMIYPKPGFPREGEIVHERSCMIPLLGLAQMMVIEWTGSDREDRLLVDLGTIIDNSPPSRGLPWSPWREGA